MRRNTCALRRIARQGKPVVIVLKSSPAVFKFEGNLAVAALLAASKDQTIRVPHTVSVRLMPGDAPFTIHTRQDESDRATIVSLDSWTGGLR